MCGVYTYTKALTNPAASSTTPIVQLKAGTSFAYRIHRITITTGSTTSTSAEVFVQRMSAAATVTAAAAADLGGRSSRDGDIGLVFSTSGTGYTGSSTGTKLTGRGPILDRTFNIVTGFDDYPVPEDRIEIQAGGIIAIFLPTAPAATYTFEITLEEMG